MASTAGWTTSAQKVFSGKESDREEPAREGFRDTPSTVFFYWGLFFSFLLQDRGLTAPPPYQIDFLFRFDKVYIIN